MTKPLGRTEPRLFTPPLRTLTPRTSKGFSVAKFAKEVLREPLLPWQKWLVVHAMELLPGGDYRFKVVLALVARQNGKTSLSKTIALWRLYVAGAKLVLGCAQDVGIAREVLNAAIDAAVAIPDLADEIDQIRRTNGDEYLKLISGGRYKISASTRSAGRGLSVDHLTMDEVREQRDWLAWSALSKTTMARPDAQTWCLSNAGDDQSVVLNHLRAAAMDGRDSSIGHFEWSGPDGCDLDDGAAIAQANPSLGRLIHMKSILSALSTDPPNVYRTEVLCQRVEQISAAIDMLAWNSSKDSSGSLEKHRGNVCLFFDMAPDLRHASLIAAAEVSEGVFRVEPVSAWIDTDLARTQLTTLVSKIKPVLFGWFPAGPAAALAPEMASLGAVALKGDQVGQACQGFSDMVSAHRILHPGDPLLTAHIAGCQKYFVGEGWRFVRKGAGHVDAAYAAAGAVHLLRTGEIEIPIPKAMMV